MDLFMLLGKKKVTESEQNKSMVLMLKNIDKHYISPGTNQKINVLESINFKVNKGESVSITGPSGSGKTTLLNICGTLDSPSSGEIEVCGHKISALGKNKIDTLRKKKIGFIFQLHHLLPQLTVLENVLIPALAIKNIVDKSIVDRGINFLKTAGLSKRMNHKPGELSGGECQRTAVVRSLINSPAIILADEPTGSLDYRTSQIICELLLEFRSREKLTLIVVTHAYELAKKMETRYVLDKYCLRPDTVADKKT